MPIYYTKIWYTTYIESEVEARDEEEAEYKAIVDKMTPDEEKQVLDNLDAMEFNNEVRLADSQYTDLDELKDRNGD